MTTKDNNSVFVYWAKDLMRMEGQDAFFVKTKRTLCLFFFCVLVISYFIQLFLFFHCKTYGK